MIYLKLNDFNQIQTNNSNHKHNLCINVEGITLVFYKINKCNYCKHFEPKFKQLESTVKGIKFAICSLDNPNKQIIEMSKGSNTLLNSVPKLILYHNGEPASIYNKSLSDDDTVISIINYLKELVPKLQSRKSKKNNDNDDKDARYIINPTTGVKEFKSGTYGIPYNIKDAEKYMRYQDAYNAFIGK